MHYLFHWCERTRRDWFRPISALKAAPLFLVALWLLPAAMWAQDTATIVGTVTDSSGAVVPGVKIILSNPDRGFTRQVASDSAGDYTAARIPIGNYVITAEQASFEKLVRSGIPVAAGQTQRVDLVLTVGQVTQQVQVSGNATKVETESGALSSVVTSNQIANLTLNGSNFLALTFLVPGAVQDNSQPEAMQLGHTGSELSASFNGNRMEYSQLEFDGGNNAQESTTGMGGAVTPSIDAIAEFRISTSNYGADVGEHAGALVEVVTKGGTKEFHGSAFEFVRNDALDSNDWFINREIAPPGGKAPMTPLKWNTFGFTLGGPVFIPNHYNKGKDKTFFFFSQEWARYRQGTVIDATVPDQAMRQGDFAECDPNSGAYLGNQYPTIFSPAYCTLPVVNGAAVDQVTPVNNNGTDWLNAFVPSPNSGPVGYVSAKSVPTNFTDTIVRVDQNFTDKVSLFVRFAADTWHNTTVPALWTGSNLDTTATAYSVPARQTVAHLNYNITPTLMNEYIMSYTNTPHTITPIAGPASPDHSIDKPSDWSASTFFPANATNKLLPAIAVYGGGPFNFDADNGDYVGPYDSEPVLTYRDNLAWTHGKHTVKTGVFLEKFRLDEMFGTETQGMYTFTNSGPITTGNGLADMFLGRINQYTEGTFNDHGVYTGGYGKGHWRRTDFEPYVQDDWRVTRRLTVNAGIRWYLLIPPHDVTNPTVDSSFIPSLYNPALAAVLNSNGVLQMNPATGQVNSFLNFGNGLVECGASGIDKGCQRIYYENLAPRVGFALDPTGKGTTSIRAAFGIYYEPGNGNDANTIGLEGNAPTTLSPTGYYLNGYNFGSGSIAAYPPAGIGAIAYYQKNPAVYQYNLNVQHQFKGNNFLSVAYVGNQGRHLDTNQNYNQMQIPVPQYMTAPGLANYAASGPVPAGFSSSCSSTGVCNPQDLLITQQVSNNYFLPYQGYSSIGFKEFAAESNYNALQTEYQHTTGHGLTLQVMYTWAHTLDNSTSTYASGLPDEDYNMNRWWGNSALNRTQVFTADYVYKLPFFKNSPNRFVRQSVGGWEVSGITTFFTGEPMTLACGVVGYSSGIGGPMQCNTVAPVKIQKGVFDDPVYGPTKTWFNGADFAQPNLSQYYANGQSGMFGYAGRDDLTGPGRNNWDLALHKDFEIPWFAGEHSTLQFRVETFNTFNHPQWNSISAFCSGIANGDGSAAFGRSCGGTAYNSGNGEVGSDWNPRNIQLGAKFNF